jgi:hypothetical protein
MLVNAILKIPIAALKTKKEAVFAISISSEHRTKRILISTLSDNVSNDRK